jgi:hypothetical protein
MTTPHILEILAKRVEAASNLDELRAALIAIEEEVESHHVGSADDVEGTIALHLDLDHLPTFGGEPPETIEGVLSWDKDRLLVGGGYSGIWILLNGGRHQRKMQWSVGPHSPVTPIETG